RLTARGATAVREHLAASGASVFDYPLARLPGPDVTFTPDHERRISALIDALGTQPFGPPALDDLAAQLQLDEEVLAALAAKGRIVRVSESIAFTVDAFDEIQRRVVARLREAGTISVSEVRDMLD